MTDAVAPPPPATPKAGKTVAVALMMGIAILLIGTLPWVGMIRLNAREHPETPWAAAATGCLLLVMLVWLSGRGWPRRSSAFRRHHLRLWRPEPDAWSGESLGTIVGLIAAMIGLSVVHVLMGATQHLERIGPTFAILMTSTVFTLLHGTHGLAYLATVAPGFFFASVVYGYLALKSGSILPGMALHFAGDLALAYLALLGGDSSRLFVD
jgi:membrane protease YdiL (CAAX protease family)